MIITTTPQIEGKQIKEYKGIVFGEVVNGVDFIKDFKAGITNILGGRSGSYEKRTAEMQGHCRQRGFAFYCTSNRVPCAS